jgi:TolB-like protein
VARRFAESEGAILRIYDLRSTYATRLSAGGVVDEWMTQLLRQGDAKVFKKYSQMKLQMKQEALQKLDRQANESGRSFDTEGPTDGVLTRSGPFWVVFVLVAECGESRSVLE